MSSKIFTSLALVLALFVLFVDTVTAQVTGPNEWQKEAIALIREITLQLILIVLGIFALLGGFATAAEKTFIARPILWFAFLFLGASVVMGLLAYGNLILTLSGGHFEALGPLKDLAKWQWVFFAIGGLLFGFFVLMNIRKRQ